MNQKNNIYAMKVLFIYTVHYTLLIFKMYFWNKIVVCEPSASSGSYELTERSPSNYRQASNISRSLANKLVDHSDVVGASPVGVAPTTSSFST